MRKRLLGATAVAVAGLTVFGVAAPAAAVVQNVHQTCYTPRTQRATVDQTGWGSITFNVTGEVLNIVQPLLVRGTYQKYSAQQTGSVRFDAATAIHSRSIACIL